MCGAFLLLFVFVVDVYNAPVINANFRNILDSISLIPSCCVGHCRAWFNFRPVHSFVILHNCFYRIVWYTIILHDLILLYKLKMETRLSCKKRKNSSISGSLGELPGLQTHCPCCPRNHDMAATPWTQRGSDVELSWNGAIHSQPQGCASAPPPS